MPMFPWLRNRIVLGVLLLALCVATTRLLQGRFFTLYLVPVGLLYLPLLCDPGLSRRDLGIFFPSGRAWLLFLGSALVFLGGMFAFTYHLLAWSWSGFIPGRAGVMLAEEILFRSLPEEFFFRGWLQGRLERPSQRGFLHFAGVEITSANLFVSLLFSLLHLVSFGGPERLLVFFPSLWFGWLRSAGGGVLLPLLAHALSNLMVLWGTKGG